MVEDLACLVESIADGVGVDYSSGPIMDQAGRCAKGQKVGVKWPPRRL